MAHRPLKIPGKKLVITKSMIEDSVKYTKSCSEASRWMGISYNTWKKYAQFYDLFEDHKNKPGKGIKKGWASYKIPMEDIFNGRRIHNYYTHSVVKKRLVNEGYMKEECALCSWSGFRISDEKICLTLDFVDGNSDNKSLENMRLLCPNCSYENNGWFNGSGRFCR
tara:strand:+ start:667 stop:1164 length:498 start_codon:yes stop_codon:yes gene_type:complete